MSLVFSAITPHPPILIPAIGKEHLAKLEKTKVAMEHLEQELYAAKPDVVFIISPHGELAADSFSINLSNKFHIDFEYFGDFATKLELLGDLVSISIGKEKMATKSPINIISVSKLDHGIGIPAYYLLKHLPEVPIVPIYFSMLDNQAHYEFGKALKELILNTDKRIAVIASGDLSHCLSENSPAPFHPDGKIFDDKLVKILKDHDTMSLISLDHKLVENARECGLKSIMILLGIIGEMSYTSEILSYESPYGIGYLTANFKLN